MIRSRIGSLVLFMGLFLSGTVVVAEDPMKVGGKGIRQDGLISMNPQGTVLVDKQGRRVLLKTKVVQQRAPLELFCCLQKTKEHESILSVDSRAQEVHAALLLVGAKAGSPVQYEPEFKPASGTAIDIFVQWTDNQGKMRREKAQTWVRHASQRFFVAPLAALPDGVKISEESDLRYDPKHRELFWFGVMSEKDRDFWSNQSEDPEYRKSLTKIFEESQIKEMKAEWVFAGSYFGRDEELKKEFYAAEDGDLICVSNFSNATLDLTTVSGNSNAQLLYEAFTERIPPLDTEVTVELIPRLEEEARGEK